MLGFFSNFYQESLYQYVFPGANISDACSVLISPHRKHYPTRGPEARLYLACFAAFLFPIGMFIYAWSSFPFVHWMGLVSGITVSDVLHAADWRGLTSVDRFSHGLL